MRTVIQTSGWGHVMTEIINQGLPVCLLFPQKLRRCGGSCVHVRHTADRHTSDRCDRRHPSASHEENRFCSEDPWLRSAGVFSIWRAHCASPGELCRMRRHRWGRIAQLWFFWRCRNHSSLHVLQRLPHPPPPSSAASQWEQVCWESFVCTEDICAHLYPTNM